MNGKTDKPGPSAPPRTPPSDVKTRTEHATKSVGLTRKFSGERVSSRGSPSSVPALPRTELVGVLLTVPVYNEVERIARTIIEIEELVQKVANRFQITLAIAEDGSTDGTKEMLQQLRAEGHTFLLIMEPDKKGRGQALRSLWQSCSYDVYAFCDADLSSDLTAIVQLLEGVQNGHDVAIGSRYIDGALVNRPVGRRLVSLMYNSLIRAIFKTGVADHQCGLKAFSRAATVLLLPLSKEDSWFWDTEMIVLARQLNLSIVELPVSWVEKKVRRTKILRLISDLYLHGSGIIRLKGTIQALKRGESKGK